MANSQYAYVRTFETPDPILPACYIVIRLDGRGFTKLCRRHAFAKPNDRRALDLMNAAAVQVLRALPDILLAYGQSDEFSFVFDKACTLFERRREKLVSTVVSLFTAEYAMLWPEFLRSEDGKALVLERPWPTFDGRAVAYPNLAVLRDYLAWRQVDCHVNNLYNTTFWNLVLRGGMTGAEAEEGLKGTVAGDKNEILFARFGVNYNDEPEMFRKGTVIYRTYDGGGRGNGAGIGEGKGGGGDTDGGDSVVDGEGYRSRGDSQANSVGGGRGGAKAPDPSSRTQMDRERKRKRKARIVVDHVDIIGDGFWEARPWILGIAGGKGG